MKGCFRDATSAKSREAWLYPQANLGSFHMPLLLHIPSRVLPHLGSLSQISGHSVLRFAGSPFTTSQLPAVCLIKASAKLKSGIGMRWLIFVIEMDEFSNVHVYSLPYLWASVGMALYPPAQAFMVRGLLWPVRRHASFPLLSAVQGNTSK